MGESLSARGVTPCIAELQKLPRRAKAWWLQRFFFLYQTCAPPLAHAQSTSGFCCPPTLHCSLAFAFRAAWSQRQHYRRSVTRARPSFMSTFETGLPCPRVLAKWRRSVALSLKWCVPAGHLVKQQGSREPPGRARLPVCCSRTCIRRHVSCRLRYASMSVSRSQGS